MLLLSGLHVEFGDNIQIGSDVTINYNCFLMDNAPITIGDHVLIGSYVGIYTIDHAIYPDDRADGWCSNAPVHIGNKVWIRSNATILPGVTIGEGSIKYYWCRKCCNKGYSGKCDRCRKSLQSYPYNN